MHAPISDVHAQNRQFARSQEFRLARATQYGISSSSLAIRVRA
jgi:hypothetical protein